MSSHHSRHQGSGHNDALDQQHYPQLHIRGRAGFEPTPSHLYNVHFAQQVTHHHRIFKKKKKNKFSLIFAT
jgi:hypothetical protein